MTTPPPTPPIPTPRTRSRAITDVVGVELQKWGAVLDRQTLREVNVVVKFGVGNRIRAVLVSVQTESDLGG